MNESTPAKRRGVKELIRDIKVMRRQPKAEIYYIQPEGEGGNVIDFDYVAEFLKGYNDGLSGVFGEYLLKWK